MKNLFGIKEGSENIDGIVYLDREVSKELSEKVENTQNNHLEMTNKTTVKGWVTLLQYILIGFGAIVIISFSNSCVEVGRDVAWKNGKYLVIAGCIALAVGLGILLYSRHKTKTGVTEEEVATFEQEADALVNECKEELRIPGDAIETDVLVSYYKDEPEKLKKSLGIQFMNLRTLVFNEDDSLCIADIQTVLKIPHSEIKRIVLKDKKTTFAGWNKPEPPKKNRYNGCKVLVQNGVIFTTKAYEIIIDGVFGEYCIIVPEYEKDVISNLLNMEIEETL